MFALALPINVFYDKLQQTPFCRRCEIFQMSLTLPTFCAIKLDSQVNSFNGLHLIVSFLSTGVHLQKKNHIYCKKKGFKMADLLSFKPGFRDVCRSTIAKLASCGWREVHWCPALFTGETHAHLHEQMFEKICHHVHFLPILSTRWCRRTNSLQHGSTGGAGDQEMSPVSSRSSVGRSTCQAKKFSKIMLKVWQSRRVFATFQGTQPAEIQVHKRPKFSEESDKAPAAQAKLWQTEDEPSAVWCTIEYLLTAEARAKADANYTLVFLFASSSPRQPEKQQGTGHAACNTWCHEQLFCTGSGTRRPLCHSSDWPTTLPTTLPLVRLADHFATRPTGRPLCHSSDWPTTSPLVRLADHFATRPTGRPLCHSSDWPTTLPLVRLADHFATRPTGRPLHHSSTSRLPSNLKFL
nr:uncharacterized protein LOC125986775 isoform X3 [Syngnathus scovelli]